MVHVCATRRLKTIVLAYIQEKYKFSNPKILGTFFRLQEKMFLKWCRGLFFHIYHWNFAINFFLYYLTGKKFRSVVTQTLKNHTNSNLPCYKGILRCNMWNNCHKHFATVQSTSVLLTRAVTRNNRFIDANIARDNANERISTNVQLYSSKMHQKIETLLRTQLVFAVYCVEDKYISNLIYLIITCRLFYTYIHTYITFLLLKLEITVSYRKFYLFFLVHFLYTYMCVRVYGIMRVCVCLCLCMKCFFFILNIAKYHIAYQAFLA